MAQIYRYTHAVVCRLPDSFKTNALGTVGTIDLNLAKEQHAIYVSSLRRLGLDVIELPSDEALPDCVFVEDTAVVVNGTAFITRPGHVSRRNEVILPSIDMSCYFSILTSISQKFCLKEYQVNPDSSYLYTYNFWTWITLWFTNIYLKLLIGNFNQ